MSAQCLVGEILVVIAAGEYYDLVSKDFVDQSVLLFDASGPVTAKFVFE